MSTLKREVPPFSSGSGTEWGFSDCYIDEVGGPKDPCVACSVQNWSWLIPRVWSICIGVAVDALAL